MRILVLSDAHHANFNTLEAIKNEPSAEIVYYLGDGAGDVDSIANEFRDKKAFIILKGNCDFSANFPEVDIRTVENNKIYACHGHNENVKYTYNYLKMNALSEKCNIVLFGHTHFQYYDYFEEIHYFNPGSIKDGFYGVIDIEKSGVLFTKKHL